MPPFRISRPSASSSKPQQRQHHSQSKRNLFIVLCLLFGFDALAVVRADEIPESPPQAFQIFLPLIQANSSTADDNEADEGAERDWDPRLDARGAVLVPATVEAGEGYWRLVTATWFDDNESQGRHHILLDALTANDERSVDLPIQILWSSGEASVRTEAKPGEAFAANYPMYALAPAYSAQPNDGAPADRVEGMGLGEIDEPHMAHHTSYGLTWRWTIAGPNATPTVTPTQTVTATVTPTQTAIATVMATATPTQTVTPTAPTTPPVTPTATIQPTAPVTATITPTTTAPPSTTPTPTPSLTPSPTPSPTPTMNNTHAFSAAVVTCQPNDSGSWFEGHVYLQGQPAAGHAITFSYEPDGPRVPREPARSDGNGFYTHILGAGVARSGDWYAWMVDENNVRISTLASFRTDGPGGACNIVTVDFTQP